MLLNDDVLVEAGCVEALVARRRRRRRRLAAHRRARPASRSPAASSSSQRGFGRHVDGARDYLSGACLCISRAAWERVGPFNEELFLYYEDVDWCLRARALGVPLRSRARRARVAQRRRVERRRAGRDLGLLLDAQPALAARAAAGRAAQRVARPRARACARALRAVQSARRAVARAKLAGVRDWSEHRMGRGPWPA